MKWWSRRTPSCWCETSRIGAFSGRGISQPSAHNPLAQFLENQHAGSERNDEEPNLLFNACRSEESIAPWRIVDQKKQGNFLRVPCSAADLRAGGSHAPIGFVERYRPGSGYRRQVRRSRDPNLRSLCSRVRPRRVSLRIVAERATGGYYSWSREMYSISARILARTTPSST